MNKTIIINMNGIIFHIEEDAYEQLRMYMGSVKQHFAYTADSDEIVSDIESRIAEMFNEMLADDKKQVIVMRDVEAVIAQMGSVADFGTDDDDTPLTMAVHPQERAEKRLYRDSDDRVIGGVCAGIGHYFSIDAKWVRFFFILLVVLFFTGFFAYIVLWIAMPKAKSRAEKMAMKGEKLNIQNFKRNFDEELEAVQNNRVVNQAGGFLSDLFEHLFNFLIRAGRLLLKILCVFIILGGLAAVVALCVTLIILTGNSSLQSTEVFNGLSRVNPEYRASIYFSAFIVFLIPLAALVLFAVRVLFDRVIISRTGVFALLVLWLTALGVGIFNGARVASNFAEEASISQTINLQPSQTGSYILEVNDSRLFSREDSVKYNLKAGEENAIDGRNDSSNQPNVSIYIEEAKQGDPATLTQKLIARGENFDSALLNARAILYSFSSRDSVLRFAKRGYLNKEQLWRDQEVVLTLKVPRGMQLKIDRELSYYIREYNINDCVPEGANWKDPARWVMTDSRLKCAIDSLNRQPEEGQ